MECLRSQVGWRWSSVNLSFELRNFVLGFGFGGFRSLTSIHTWFWKSALDLSLLKVARTFFLLFIPLLLDFLLTFLLLDFFLLGKGFFFLLLPILSWGRLEIRR